MALSFTEVGGTRVEAGQLRARTYDVTFDSSYPTGGETINPQNVGLATILFAVPAGQYLTTGSALTTSFFTQYNPITGKIQLFTSNGAAAALLAEYTNGGSASTSVFRYQFWGY